MSIDTLTSGDPARYVLAGAALGALDLAVARLLPPGAVVSVLSLILALAILAVTALAGGAAVRRGQRPGWAGALPSLAYGVISGLDAFFQHTTLSQARALLRNQTTHATVTAQQIVHAANATSTHLIQFLSSALFLAIFGIVVGSLGGIFARRRFQAADTHAV